MSVLPRTLGLLTLGTALVPRPALAQDADGWRTIEIETTEVTAPDVAITPDGESLIFTLLGHLFRLPVEGGEAEQLTFGPYYDARPTVSPDGTQVAFQSDRDGSEGNIFLLNLATGDITQLTDEPWADAPSWAPDGQSVVYLLLLREAWNIALAGPNRTPRGPPPPAVVRRVRLNGSEPETLRADVSEVRSPFHMPDGRVGWAVVERETTSPRATTRIDVMDRDGTSSTIRTLDGVAVAVVASDSVLFVRRHIPVMMRGDFIAQQNELVRVPLAGGRERSILPVSDVCGHCFRGRPRFALSAAEATLYIGNLGRLWRVSPDENEREAIAFRATVTMDVRDPVAPPKWTIPEPGTSAPPRSIRFPRLSPDGRRLVFRAAGSLWEQSSDGGPIRRLSDTGGIGVAFSPDGSRLAFFAGSELRLLDFSTDGMQTVEVLERGNAIRPRVDPSWMPDGEGLIAWENVDAGRARLLVIRTDDGTKETLAEVRRHRSNPPDGHTTVSTDGQWLYFLQGGWVLI